METLNNSYLITNELNIYSEISVFSWLKLT